MMRLLEYEAKQLFRASGIPVPMGEVVSSMEAAAKLYEALEGKAVIKAQVPVGGRGKAGGVSVVHTSAEAAREAERILSLKIKGYKVEKLLIEQVLDIQAENYVSLVLDRDARRFVVMVSAAGGMDIEEVAAKTPEMITKRALDPLLGLRSYQITRLIEALDPSRVRPEFKNGATKYSPETIRQLREVFQGVYDLAKRYEATLVEINPLVVDVRGRVWAADGKIELDESGLPRCPSVSTSYVSSTDHPLEVRAKEEGLAYVKLDGDVGVIGNGAGLVMATLDSIKEVGGSPANFLDLGGGAKAETVKKALELVLSDEAVRAMLINVFGGITRCDEVAKGLVSAISSTGTPPVPLMVRLAGTRSAEGIEILRSAGINCYGEFSDAAREVVRLAKAG